MMSSILNAFAGLLGLGLIGTVMLVALGVPPLLVVTLRRLFTRRPIPKWLSVAWAAGAVVLAAAYLLALRPLWQLMKQHRTASDMRVVSTLLHDYRDRHGGYPAELAAALPVDLRRLLSDAWGHPLLYFHTDQQFILVSVGKDGRPDYPDYWAVRATYPHWRRVRDHPESDLVLSDLGWSQCN
jgi:hypothetical protein